MVQRPEQRAVAVVAVAGGVQVGAQPRRGLRVDRERVAPAALADDAQRIEAAVLVQIPDLERGDLGAAQPDLQADGQDGAVAQAGSERVLPAGGRSSSLRACALEKAAVVPSSRLMAGRSISRTGFLAAWPCRTRCLNRLDSADRRRRMVDGAACSVSRMCRSQAITARWSAWRSSSVRGDAERRHEVPHVEPVGPAGAGALLLGQPDLLLGDVGELRQHRRQGGRGRGGADDRGRGRGGGVAHGGRVCHTLST